MPPSTSMKAWYERYALDALVKLGVGANKSFHLPKGTPPDVVEAWRSAAGKMVNDPLFLKRKPAYMIAASCSFIPAALKSDAPEDGL